MNDLFAKIRTRTAEVVRRARSVQVDPAGVEALAERLLRSPLPRPAWDRATHHAATAQSTLAYVLTLDAVNFGSGYFPHLRKRPGCSGYFTIAIGLKERFDAKGPWSPWELAQLEVAELAGVLAQDRAVPEVAELLELQATGLRALGTLLLERHAGRFEGIVEEARSCAQSLVCALSAMPFFRDVAAYEELSVPFYKRAQLTVADLSLALEGRGLGRFRDLEHLTAFADNLVPHVLRLEGVLRYAPELLRRIEAAELLAPGSPEEVEVRAAGVQGVERLVEAMRRRGSDATPHTLDFLLWQRGQGPEPKAHARHRTRSVYY